MILTCPECATRYQADAAQFQPSGRKVRCARCGHVWHQSAPLPEPEIVIPEAEPVAAPEPAPPAKKAVVSSPAIVPTPAVAREPAAKAPAAQPGRRRWPMRAALAAGWLMLIAAAGGIAWSLISFRTQIATLWPQSASLYSAIGLKTGTAGLDIENYASHRAMENGEPVLLVTGVIVNSTARELPVPTIRAALTDSDSRELYHWTFMADAMTLGAGKRTPFHARLANPPRALRHVELRFAKDGE